jgi:beta-glucosidase/6-phospho-beta-glucosidase/beta-galactosidase
MLLLCDGGGSNGCLHHVVKEQLKKLCDKLQIEIVVAHYPAYCSKWNPIEHRAFCHITRFWQGVVFKNYDIVKELAESTTTETGFSVEVTFNDKEYKTGNKASAEFLASKPYQSDEILPKWNYSFKPQLL